MVNLVNISCMNAMKHIAGWHYKSVFAHYFIFITVKTRKPSCFTSSSLCNVCIMDFHHPSHCVYTFNIYNRAVDEKKVMSFHEYRDITRTWKLIIESKFSWYFPKLSTKILFFFSLFVSAAHTHIHTGLKHEKQSNITLPKDLIFPITKSKDTEI